MIHREELAFTVKNSEARETSKPSFAVRFEIIGRNTKTFPDVKTSLKSISKPYIHATTLT